MRRRRFLTTAAASLAIPAVTQAADRRVLRFVPHADLAVLDPLWTNALVTRNHALLVFDTLFGQDDSMAVRPQMVEGADVSAEGRRWTLRLRDGLRFHDGEPVLARDCVASLRRWGRRDAFGQSLFAVTDELLATDDRTIVFRLNRPFPMLPDALGKATAFLAPMMPARIAESDSGKPITEMVGSGPYRFVAAERMAGDRVVYERFDRYVPNPTGTPSFIAGPKQAQFDRIEWKVMPDAATAGAALQNGEVDWWEMPTPDMLPLLRRSRRIAVEALDPYGQIPTFRINHLHPPFNNPAIRRALLGAVDQRDVVMAIAGDDPALWRTGVGYFTPGPPMASTAGLQALEKRPAAAVKQDLARAGYAEEPVMFMVSTDSPMNLATGEVVADAFRKAGLNIDYRAMDFGTVVQRRLKPEPVAQGGWNGYCSGASGLEEMIPPTHLMLRGNGMTGPNIGWPTSPDTERLRAEWLDAQDLVSRKAIAEKLQRQALQDVPYIPLGQVLQPSAYDRSLTGLLKGAPLFWNVRRG